MNLKNLYISAGVLAILAIITSYLNSSNNAPLLDERVGSTVVDKALLRNAAKAIVNDDDQTLTLIADSANNRWTLEEKHNLPVSYSRISQLAQSITEAKLQRLVSENPDRIAELGFDTGTAIRFLDSDGNDIVSLELGKETDNQRQFLRYQGEEKAFLANTTFNINSSPDSWLEKALVSFEAGDVVGIETELQYGDSLSVTREDENADWQSEELPDGKILNQSSVTQIATRLAGLNFSATADKDGDNVTAARDNSHRFKLTLKDGRSYTYTIGRQPEVSIEKQAEKTDENGETTTETESEIVTPEGPVYFFIAAADNSDPVNGYMEKSAFEASSYQYTSLPTSTDTLLSDAPEPVEETQTPLVIAPEETSQ
ncbi:MAG: DUF4340 domain-containing protein [Opitutales bacterium]|jgi:hypothetical protein|nr:DUF4340 domain-containing protein [Opitutales bacterium]MBT6768340.1 DUF4340 domain-containing protein [Opitutales bacterium]MBT7866960.1 DUF4340 domain-containing protein [Opitutales bacterium]